MQAELITLEYLRENYGNVDMLLCGRHNLGEDRMSICNIDTFILTSFLDDRYDPITATTKTLKLKDILENIEEYNITIDNQNDTIVIHFGNGFKHKKED